MNTLRLVSPGCLMLRLGCVKRCAVVGVGVVSVALTAAGSSSASVQAAAGSQPLSHWKASAPATRIHLDLRQRRISVIRDGQQLGRWPVAIGDPSTPTPTGFFQVESKLENPRYQSTKSGKVHPVTGLASPLGHRWIGFLQQGPNQFGIHGTPWPHWVKIRAAVSNGCVRMLNADVQKLYELVEVGTPVVITQ